MTTVERLRTGMVQQMISSGCLRSRPWITAFRNLPRHVFLPRDDFGMIAALRLPGVASIEFTPASGPQRWLLADDGSWACLDETAGTVAQHGARRLWDEIEDAHHQWTRRGAPTRDRFGLTVTSTGEHRFWLDIPHEVWWSAR